MVDAAAGISAGTGTRFHLASPKFHLGTVSGYSRNAVQMGALEQSSSLGVLLRWPGLVMKGPAMVGDSGSQR